MNFLCGAPWVGPVGPVGPVAHPGGTGTRGRPWPVVARFLAVFVCFGLVFIVPFTYTNLAISNRV